MKTPISRRKALIGLITSGITVVASAIAAKVSLNPSKNTRAKKVVWERLTPDHIIGPGILWASCDPNTPLEQQEKHCNLQIQAFHPDYYGKALREVGFNSGDYWRPIAVVDCQASKESMQTFHIVLNSRINHGDPAGEISVGFYMTTRPKTFIRVFKRICGELNKRWIIPKERTEEIRRKLSLHGFEPVECTQLNAAF